MRKSTLSLLFFRFFLAILLPAAACHGPAATDQATARAMDGGGPEDAAKLMESVRGSIKNHPLRQAYEDEVVKLSERARALEQQGRPLSEIARTMHQARRDLGVRYKNATPEPLRAYIYEVNQARYGDPLGPSFDFLVKKHTRDGVVNYRAIIDGACRPNPDVDKLLAGFAGWLRHKGKSK